MQDEMLRGLPEKLVAAEKCARAHKEHAHAHAHAHMHAHARAHTCSHVHARAPACNPLTGRCRQHALRPALPCLKRSQSTASAVLKDAS
eukprot:3099720-Pleurochrysis_carterae.AAC.3